MFFLLISIILSSVTCAPIELQSSVTLPPAIAANLDEYSRLHYRLGALMSDLDMLIYAEEGSISPEELKKLVKETYETADKAMQDRILVLDKDLKERAELLDSKGVKVEGSEVPQGKDLETLQSNILKAREDLSEINDEEENVEEMKKKYTIDKDIISSMKGLHAELKKMIKEGAFEKDIKSSMKILGPRGPFGTALV